MAAQLILRPSSDPWLQVEAALETGESSIAIWQRFKPLLPDLTLEMVVMRRRVVLASQRRRHVSRDDWF